MSFEVYLGSFTLGGLPSVELEAQRRSSELAMEKRGHLGLQVLQSDLAECIILCPRLSSQANHNPLAFCALPCTYLNKAEKIFERQEFLQVYGLYLSTVVYTIIDQLRIWASLFQSCV